MSVFIRIQPTVRWIPVEIILPIGMEEVIAVVSVTDVHLIVAPRCPVVIDMRDEQPIAWTTIVPPFLLTVL